MSKRKLPPATIEALIVLIALGLALVAGFAGWGIGHHTRATRTVTVGSAGTSTTAATVDPHVAAGAHVFVQFACAQCHGMQGKGGVSPDVPALTGVGTSLSAARLRTIIDHGLGESANPTKPYMPVWGPVISETQVSDLIAYLRAGLPKVPTASPPPVPSGQGAAVQGSVLYVNVRLHQLPRPERTRRRPQPPVPGQDDPAALRPGLPLRVQHRRQDHRRDPLGQRDRKAPIVSMPHWGGIIPDDQLQALAAYLKTLK